MNIIIGCKPSRFDFFAPLLPFVRPSVCPPYKQQYNTAKSARSIVQKEQHQHRGVLAYPVKVFRLESISAFIRAIYCQGRFVDPVHKLPFLLRLLLPQRSLLREMSLSSAAVTSGSEHSTHRYIAGNCCGENVIPTVEEEWHYDC